MRVIGNNIALCLLLLLLSIPAWALQMEPKSIVVDAKGTGVLKVGDEQFKVTGVVIKLFEGGKAEINLISEITVFINGTWARAENDKKLINLKITGGATGGGIAANGEVHLRGEKAIESVSLEGEITTTHRTVTLTFQAAD
jgi:hypothetical protein